MLYTHTELHHWNPWFDLSGGGGGGGALALSGRLASVPKPLSHPGAPKPYPDPGAPMPLPDPGVHVPEPALLAPAP